MIKRILIADVDPAWCRRLQGIYEHNGHLVECAANAVDAIRVGLVFIPDLILTGWELDEDTSGLRVAHALLKRQQNTRVVFLTNLNPKELEPQCDQLGLHEFLDRRVSPATLLALLGDD